MEERATANDYSSWIDLWLSKEDSGLIRKGDATAFATTSSIFIKINLLKYKNPLRALVEDHLGDAEVVATQAKPRLGRQLQRAENEVADHVHVADDHFVRHGGILLHFLVDLSPAVRLSHLLHLPRRAQVAGPVAILPERVLDARGVPEEPRLPGAPELPLRAREVQAGRALREHRVDLGNLHPKLRGDDL